MRANRSNGDSPIKEKFQERIGLHIQIHKLIPVKPERGETVFFCMARQKQD
jgi:hypothetical protein